MKTRFQHALIIGASSGIGAEMARQLAADGTRVALVARRAERLEALAEEIENAVVLVRDVRDVEGVDRLIQEIARELGGLDLVVYAAGVLHSMPPETYDTARDLEMIATNLAAAVAWLNPVAERFGRLGAGTIVGIGSVAGDRGRVGNPVYNATKAGLATYLEALRNRIHRKGARVVTVKPGFVATEMTEGMSGLFWVVPADKAARLILRHAHRGSVTAYVPGRWRWVMAVIRSIPSVIFRRLSV